MPDLCIAYISLAPRYPAYSVVDEDGFPAAAAPESNRPLSEEELGRIQRRPRAGEDSMATGRVVNHGDAPSGPFRYTWSLDGRTVAQGRHEGLAAGCRAEGATEVEIGEIALREAPLRPGTYVDLALPLKWRSRGQRLRLTARLEAAGAPERKAEPGADSVTPTRDNNTLEERTDALTFLITVGPDDYNRWAALGAGRGGGFDDWVQRQFELLRGRFQGSTYAQAPQGVEQPIRIDTIRVLEAQPELQPAARAAGWDGAWTYDASRRVPVDAARAAEEPDEELFRGIMSQLGIVDLAVLGVTPEQVGPGDAGQPMLLGYAHPSPPAAGGAPLSEHTVLALNRMLGRRRGFRGTYLFDLPRNCRLRVLDNNGRELPEAEVTVFQKEGKRVDSEPLAEGRTNANGEFPLPNRPAPPLTTADGFTLRESPFGALRASGENGLLLVRVRARGFTDHLWMPVTGFNLAVWHGQARTATFELRTRLPATSAPDPPRELRAMRRPGGGVLLRWRAPDHGGVGGYALYRGVYPTYAWERITAVSYLNEEFPDPAAPSDGKPVRYGAAALSLSGDESGLAELTLPGSR